MSIDRALLMRSRAPQRTRLGIGVDWNLEIRGNPEDSGTTVARESQTLPTSLGTHQISSAERVSHPLDRFLKTSSPRDPRVTHVRGQKRDVAANWVTGARLAS